jgi:hypothetical protein
MRRVSKLDMFPGWLVGKTGKRLVFQNELFIFINMEGFPCWESFPSWDEFARGEEFPICEHILLGKCFLAGKHFPVEKCFPVWKRFPLGKHVQVAKAISWNSVKYSPMLYICISVSLSSTPNLEKGSCTKEYKQLTMCTVHVCSFVQLGPTRE